MSPRFKKELPLILNVPNFSGVRFHGGNTENDSEGCPLLGMVRHMDSISNCAPAVALVTKMIKEAKEAQLTIVWFMSGHGRAFYAPTQVLFYF